VFFGQGDLAVNDPQAVLDHENGASGLASAWIEAGPALEQLLQALGSRPCGTVALPDGPSGERWALARGSLVLLKGRKTRRVLGVELQRRTPGNRQLWEPLAGFRVQLQ
jgi:hypothetical protein